jgi:sugar-specific transcriptional regulator TrmB
MNMLESLSNIGLREKEGRVYLALLQLGKTTAYQIAVRSGLKKPTTYVVLEELAIKGFVNKIPRAKKFLYKAVSPDKCFALARERMESAEQALPELMAAQKGKSEKVNVSYFEGLEGIKEMYGKLEKRMKEKPVDKRKFQCLYSHSRDAASEYLEYRKELGNELRRLQIRREAVMTEDESVKWYFENARNLGIEAKSLPKEIYDSNVSYEIYDRYVQIISHQYQQGTLIENEDVADSLKQIFKIVWQKAGKT